MSKFEIFFAKLIVGIIFWEWNGFQDTKNNIAWPAQIYLQKVAEM